MTWQKRQFRVTHEIAITRRAAWDLLSNTEHLNRAIGLPPVNFAPFASDQTILHRPAQSRMAGLNLNYREYPFNWIQNQEYGVRRVFQSGPLSELICGIRLHLSQHDANHTQLEIYADITPANTVGAALCPAIARDSFRKTWNYVSGHLQGIVEPEQKNPNTPKLLPAPRFAPVVNRAHFDLALNRLRAMPFETKRARLETNIIELLGRWLAERGDDEVNALKPLALAKLWQTDEHETLRVFLYATKAGLLDLSWNLMCPNCRVSKGDAAHLEGVSSPFHCDACGVNYQADFDRYIELRFRPQAALRNVGSGEFCVAGPFAAPHILVQQTVGAGSEQILPMPDETGALRLRVVRANHVARWENSGEALEKVTAIYHDGWQNSILKRAREIEVRNEGETEILVVIEREEWDDLALTAARVSTLAEFRDLFGSEVLAPGQHIGVQSLTLFFSDLKDSTAMYEAHGDAPAFGRVRAHFDYLSEHIEAGRGGVVKTVGDAVMAVFPSPEEALRAALEMQKQLPAFNASQNRENGAYQELILKIGLHFGPALAVTSNDRLDYFGRTVNLASRIQGASMGTDIVVSGEIFDRPTVAAILKQYGARTRRFDANLKGIEGMTAMYRVTL